MDERKALQSYLFERPPSKSQRSCFMAALRDARKATGRYKSNGTKRPRINHGNWLGAIGYMTLLDQIGECLKPKGKHTEYTYNIKRALDYFDSGLNDNEINALYALRCSFAHNFSLININRSSKNKSIDKLTHCFSVYVDDSKSIIDLPNEKWDGDLSETVDNITGVNLEALGDLVETICSKIIEKYDRDQLEITLPIEEFLVRFFFHTGTPFSER